MNYKGFYKNVCVCTNEISNVKNKIITVYFSEEAGMLTKKLLMQIDSRLRDIFGEPNIPFGGMSIICIGDFHQLPPVGGSYAFNPFGNHPKEKLAGPTLWKKFKIFELAEIMRQRDDKVNVKEKCIIFTSSLNNNTIITIITVFTRADVGI